MKPYEKKQCHQLWALKVKLMMFDYKKSNYIARKLNKRAFDNLCGYYINWSKDEGERIFEIQKRESYPKNPVSQY